MAEVTINTDETPTEQLVTEAKREAVITDARGRTIRLVKPGVMSQFKLVKILGATATNEVYMGMCLPLLFVRQIDDSPVSIPTSEIELEALIERLDEDGLTAVAAGITEHFDVIKPEQAREAVKN